MKLLSIITIVIISFNNLFASNYKCDVFIDNNYFKTCYSFEHNSAIWSYAKILNENNDVGILKRPSFYADKRIPLEHRVFSTDYTNSGFDRGHLQNDSNFDYSEESLKETYAMSNITPQYPKTNQISNRLIENRQREILKEQKEIEIYIFVYYSKNRVKNKISIPSYFYIITSNKKNNFKECYILNNDNLEYTLQQMKTDC